MAEEFDMEKWRGKTLTREQFNKLSPIEMAAFLESGGGGRITEGDKLTMKRAEFNLLSLQEQAAFIRSGGTLYN